MYPGWTTYDAAGRLTRISYPNGVHAHWNWAPAWVPNWSNASGIEIRHTASSTPPAWAGPSGINDAPHEDSTFLVFENISSRTHFAG